MLDPMTTPTPDPDRPPSTVGTENPLVLPLAAIEAGTVALVGGKASSLGDLLRAGFSVPDGFCVTTAAYALVSQHAALEPIIEALAATSPSDTARLEQHAEQVRAALLSVSLPAMLADAIGAAMRRLDVGSGSSPALAVRSSATAEDLPWASFAGQQETFLNISGQEAVLAAVQRCFASLWTTRAVTYRAHLGIDPRTVRLAVVVQHLVDAEVAGVLFTANPLTGKRREVVIEANPGLGEAVVSGATTPDHFVVAMPRGEIVERRLGDKSLIIRAAAGGGTEQHERAAMRTEACLSDARIQTLAVLGMRVEAHVGAPQDLEWALDGDGHCWLLQARAITTLFPLPQEAPVTDEELRVYLCFGVQQGTTRPFTPMGFSAIRLLASGLTTLMGLPPSDPLQGPRFIVEAGSRIFLDLTRALRSAFGRRLLTQMMADAEVHVATGIGQLVTDPRLSLLPGRRWRVFRSLLLLTVRTWLPWYLLQALLFPRIAQARVQRLVRQSRYAGTLSAKAMAPAHLRAAERLLAHEAPRLLPRISPVMVAGMQAHSAAKNLLGDLASEEECQAVLRGSPTNPTVQMTLALWALAQQARTDPATALLFQERPVAELAVSYRAGHLPAPLQNGLAAFLAMWGHQAVAELDLGLARWSEDPAVVLDLMATYLGSGDREYSPQRQIERMAQEAEAMIRTLTRRARKRGWLRAWLVGVSLRRAHDLAGYREMTRFAAALLLAQARSHLLAVGSDLAKAGRLERAEDVFFLTLPEAHAALDGHARSDWRALVRERHTRYEEELMRRHVPLLLRSDGTEPVAHEKGQAQGISPSRNHLQGTAASPGLVMGSARVTHDPVGARLEPGEILVAPSTDPGWTPLFLVAGGLVMELGGAMAHGAIVAREYGLPAVVGVRDATQRIRPGQRITVDGTTGTVTLWPDEAD
ncbi:MAG TPA: PEP/pyruvate-binding domain-containing protein [Ktedonobacterales bacterium]